MLVLDNRGIIGPLGTGCRFDGMDQALVLFVEKNAEVVRAGLDVNAVVFLTTILFLERFGRNAQKTGDPFTFIRVDVDAPFAVTAFPAFFTIKGFHTNYQAPTHDFERERRPYNSGVKGVFLFNRPFPFDAGCDNPYNRRSGSLDTHRHIAGRLVRPKMCFPHSRQIK